MASQVRAVLEENHSLLSRHKSQQRLVSELQAQLRTRGQRSAREWPGLSAQVSCTCAESTAEGELVQLEREKKGKELQLQQVMDGHTHLANQVSRLVGVAVGGANSTEHPDTLQCMAGSVASAGVGTMVTVYLPQPAGEVSQQKLCCSSSPAGQGCGELCLLA